MVVECPEQHAAAAPTSGAIAGRIDMDLEDDSAYLYSDETAKAGCSLLLVVETAIGQVHSVPISGEGIDPGRAAIRYLGRVDERPGAEIVVRMLTGASTEFVALFSLGDGRLERMTVETEDPYGDLFPSGGSVGHLEATDCASNAGDDGYIVMSLATPQGDGYRLRRTFYTSSDGAFDVDEIVEQKLSDPQDLEAYQEFSGTPFGTCAAGS